MFNEICRINPNRRKVYIVDARSYIAAVGNKAIGGGYEDLQYYKNCQIVFGDIENIHAVRDAYRKLFSLCENSFQTKDKKNILNVIKFMRHKRKHIFMNLINYYNMFSYQI